MTGLDTIWNHDSGQYEPTPFVIPSERAMSEGLDAILRLASTGDQAAWRNIVDRYGPRVFGLIRTRCGDPDLAEEITQSVFCTVAEKLGSTESGGYVEQGRFESWLFRIAVNRLRDEMRRRRRQAVASGQDDPVDDFGPPSTGADHPAGLEERDEKRHRAAALTQAMAELGDADRQVVELRHIGGLSFKQIAELLDEPIGTVLARQHRALRKLKGLLTEHLEPCETGGE